MHLPRKQGIASSNLAVGFFKYFFLKKQNKNKKRVRPGSNRRPWDLQSHALPLSYTPIFVSIFNVKNKKNNVKPMVRFELTTPCLQGKCNNHYATSAHFFYDFLCFTVLCGKIPKGQYF